MSSEKKSKFQLAGCIWLTAIFHSNDKKDKDGGGRAHIHPPAGDARQGEREADRVGLPRPNGSGDHRQARADCHVRYNKYLNF